MIIVAGAVLLTGAMLVSGGVVLALQSPPGRRPGIAMSICGGVLMLLAAFALFLSLVAIIPGAVRP
jgi:hypothetical protein